MILIGWEVNTSYYQQMKEKVRARYSQENMAHARTMQALVSKQLIMSENLAAFISIMPVSSMEQRIEECGYSFIRINPGIRKLSFTDGQKQHSIFSLRYRGDDREDRLIYSVSVEDRDRILEIFEQDDGSKICRYEYCLGAQLLVSQAPVYRDGILRGIVTLSTETEYLYRESVLKWENSAALTALKDDAGELIHGDGDVFLNEPVLSSIDLDGRKWELGMIPRDGWTRIYIERMTPFLLLTALLLTIISLVFNYLISKYAELRTYVQSQEHLYRNIFSSIQNAVIIFDNQGYIREVNQPAFQDLFGLEEDEVIGRSSDILFQNRSNGIVLGQSCGCEVVIERKDGRLFWGQVQVDDLRNQSGKIIGSIAVVQNITDRMQIQEKLEAQLKEKEVLLNEIHHRVKNNLNIVSSLLSLQKGEIDSIEEAREAFDESCSRIHSIALIHESLYHSNNFSMIRMDAYIENMIGHFNEYFDKSRHVEYEIDADNLHLDIVKAVPCGIIINELVTNSLKHAFPDNRQGTISISLKLAEDSRIELRVTDNGIGIPESVELESATTLGLNLVKILSEQLNGTLSIADSLVPAGGISDRGASICVCFPSNENHW